MPGPWGVGSLLQGGPSGGPGGPFPRGWTPDGLHRRLPGPLRMPPLPHFGPPRSGPLGGGGRWAYGACHGDLRARPWVMWEAPPCLPLGWRRAPRATLGVPASPRLCSTCPHIGGILLVPWPPLPEEAAEACGWRPPAPGQRVGGPAEPCAAPACGPGPTYRGLPSGARVRGRRAARLPAATLASV